MRLKLAKQCRGGKAGRWEAGKSHDAPDVGGPKPPHQICNKVVAMDVSNTGQGSGRGQDVLSVAKQGRHSNV